MNFSKLTYCASLVTLIALTGCTGGTELVQEITDVKVANNFAIQGEFCAPAVPAQQERDIKFILLYDASQSMFNNDPVYTDPLSGQPTNQRLEATKVLDSQIVDACANGIPNLFESMVIFGSQPNILTAPPFVQCGLPPTIYPTFLAQAGGVTNIVDAVQAVKDLISNDIDVYVNNGQAGLRQVVYYLIFASDGRPDNGLPGTQVEETNNYILAQWKNVVNLTKLYNWVELRADTYLLKGIDLVSGTPQSIQDLNLQRQLLTGFNLEVPGSYYEIDTTTQTQGFAFNFPNVYNFFTPVHINQIVAINRSAHMDFTTPETLGFKIDSDNDGASDAREALLGTDPLAPDSDGDGCNDFAEDFLGLNPLDATDCPITGSELGDTDGDGANDGTEIILGSNPFDPDSDNDGIPDYDEILNHMNPNEPLDQATDLDADGEINKKEFIDGYDLLNANPSDAKAFAINYDVSNGSVQSDGSYCVDIKASNILVRDTLSGQNRIDLLILFGDNFDNHGIALKSFDVNVGGNTVLGASTGQVLKDEWTVY